MAANWVAVGENGDQFPILWSTDGNRWYDASGGGGGYGTKVAYGKNKWVAVGFFIDFDEEIVSTIKWSPNGILWKDVSGGFTSEGGESF